MLKKILIFIVVLVLFVACTESRRHTRTEQLNMDSLAEASPKADTVTFINKQILENLPDKRLNININFPQIVYYYIVESQQIFNSVIKFITDNARATFEMEIPEKHFLDSLPMELKNDFNIEYEIINNSSSISSVLFNISQFQAGAAHPLNYHKSVNFDLHRGKLISEYDFFQDTLLLYKISELSRIKLLKNMINSDSSWVISGTQPLLENFRNFNIGKDSLYITFDQYQVGPYSDGSFKIGLHYKQFDTLLPNIIIK